jgi:uncharacterized damage-inducible protein DinB
MTPPLPLPVAETLLDALLDSWRRNNLILINLLRALPEADMDLRGTDGGPTVRELFMHMHYCRLVFVHETAPEVGVVVPSGEWRGERDRDRIAALLGESADALRDAVRGRLLAGRPMDQHYDHPILLLQHFVWHEGYHHGQIKIALKAAGRPFDDEEIGQVTWDVWMEKKTWAARS